jgi:hypothetical protein
MTHFFLDENLSEYVAEALNYLNRGHFKDVEVYSTKTKFQKGIPDTELIPEIGKSGGILITRDINIPKTRLLYKLCQDYQLGIFFLKMPKNQDNHWALVKSLINNWDEVVKKSFIEKKPFAYIIKVKGRMEKL